MDNAVTALAPYRVLDLTGEDGWLCGRILGDLGADVVKIEPPGGDPDRKHGPYYHDEHDPEKSLTWFAFNANKRGITLDLNSSQGQSLFRRLAQKADFVIESYRPGYLDERGLGYRALQGMNARLIFTSITPFGQTGPYAQFKGSDLQSLALSGFMSLVGDPGKAPLRNQVPQAPVWACMYAASGTLLAHYYRQTTGKGQQVDVSQQASLLWALANAPSFWSLNRENLHRAGALIIGRSIKGAKMTAIYPCLDGQINFIIYGGEAGKRSNEGMVGWMKEHGAAPEWLQQKNWDDFNVATSTQEEIDQLEEPFGAFLAGRTKAEFADESVKRGILGYPVNNARDIREDPQLVARDFWTQVEHPELHDTITYPGVFAKFSRSQHSIRRRAPRVGEHNREIYVDELKLSEAELAGLAQARVI